MADRDPWEMNDYNPFGNQLATTKPSRDGEKIVYALVHTGKEGDRNLWTMLPIRESETESFLANHHLVEASTPYPKFKRNDF